MAMHEASQNLWYQLALLAKMKGLLMSPLKPDTIAELRTVTLEEQFLREGNAKKAEKLCRRGRESCRLPACSVCVCNMSDPPKHSECHHLENRQKLFRMNNHHRNFLYLKPKSK
jgi:hypothetical protein